MKIEKHKEIGKWLNNKPFNFLGDIHKAFGKSSDVSKTALKIEKNLTMLKSQMEKMAYKDGYSDCATDIYYPNYLNGKIRSTEIHYNRNGFIRSKTKTYDILDPEEARQMLEKIKSMMGTTKD